MKVVKYLGFNRPFADSKGLCGANPKYLTTAEHGGIFFEISPARFRVPNDGTRNSETRLSPAQRDDGGQAFQKHSLPY
jgi:hypothetical protein